MSPLRPSLSRRLPAIALLVAASLGCAVAQVTPSDGSAPTATPAPSSAVDREVKIAEDGFRRDPVIPAWVTPAPIPEAKAEGAATQLLLESQIRVGETVVTFNRRATRVNDPVALSSAGRVPILFIPDYQRIVLHTLRIWRDGQPLDRIGTAQIRFLQRETGLEQNLYSGAVTASMLLEDVRVGDTIEVAYSVTGSNPVFGPKFSWIGLWDHQSTLALRRVVLLTPPGRQVGWKGEGSLNAAVPKPHETTRDGWRVLTFEEKQVAAVNGEPLVPNGYSLGRFLEFSEYGSWQEVATWAAALFDVHDAPDAARRALVESWRAKPTEEQIVAALEFVQSQVRYFSVSLGTSSHRPALPNTVLARRYGDCKDKSLLLVALLGDLGIHAEAVLARNGNRTGFDDWLPTPLAFDHVFVAVDVAGTRYWLDPTRLGQHGRLARMGQVHDGAEVLVASRDTQALARITVANRDELAKNDMAADLVVDQLDGKGVLTVQRTLNGVGAETLRVFFGATTLERIQSALTSDAQKTYPDARLDGPVTFDDDRSDNSVHVRYRFTLPVAMQKTSAGWVAKLVPENMMRMLMMPPDGQRRAPLAISNPLNASFRFDLHLPDDVSAASDDAPAHIANAYFDWTSERSFRGNHAYVAMHFTTLQSRVPPGDVALIKADLQRVDQSQSTTFVVRTADLRRTGILGIGGETLAAKIKARQEQRINVLGKSIDGGKLASRDLARAYCERGRARASLERLDQAREDGDRAVAAEAQNPQIIACRAYIRLAGRDYAGAIDDASQAIVLGDEGGAAYFVRSRAEMLLGRYHDALQDLDRLDGSGTMSLAFRDIWRAIVIRRMSQPLPADLVPAGAENAPWPRPALALFAERITPERLAALSQAAGDAGEMNATEADFFTGEYFLAKGSIDDARRAFESARRRGIIDYAEYDAAGAELDHLKDPAR